jgi:aspartate racemase
MVKHIGIVACSAEGAALCYTTICLESQGILGKFEHPEITMHSLPFSEYMLYIQNGDWEKVGELMVKSANIVSKAGAEFAICPDNTIHEENAYNLVLERSPIPFLHIADVVAEEAKEKDFSRLGILGTKYLMGSSVYPDALDKMKIKCVFPSEEDKLKIDKIIFTELVNGLFLEESRFYFNEIIRAFKESGCDGVVLGCTEIPLLIKPDDCPLPILDSTRLLARMAIQTALE